MKLDKVFRNAKRISIDDYSKLVIMSDCHRGSGDNDDNFIKNQNIFKAALLYYYARDFTYVELGDGDEMWEVKNYKNIIEEHLDIFKQIKKFYDSNRLIMIYGNHDADKKHSKILEKYFYTYCNQITKKRESLLSNLEVYEAVVLTYKNYDIFMLHGHQVDFFNNELWRVSKFLVRHVWRHLEHFGIKDPTSTAKNYRGIGKVEKKLKKWSSINHKMLIAGHTHRPSFPRVGQSLYFNDGCCIHPSGITCIEIENGHISLAKWEFKIKEDAIISVGRTVIDSGNFIINFF